MHRAPTSALLLLGLAAAVGPPGASAQDPDAKGPPAFVPLESPAARAQLRDAADLAREGKSRESAEAYQAVVDGPLAERLVANEKERNDTLEQARERAHREIAVLPALAESYRRRFEETAGGLLAAALDRRDERGLREAFARFPLAPSGARAGFLLARAAWRRGDPEDCLGILDRLLDLRAAGLPAGVDRADLLALRGAAAAATGDLDLLARVEREAADLGPGAKTAAGGEALLAERLAACRRSAPSAPEGPRGRLALLWKWMPDAEGGAGGGDGPSMLPVNESELPPFADHFAAVSGGRVFWADRFRVTALDLATGRPLARSRPLGTSGRVPDATPGIEHGGETFAPAADDGGVVAVLDHAGPSPGGRRAGMLGLFDPDLRCLEARGGPGDAAHPEMSFRFVFHGRPLLLGDRVYVAATESAPAGAQAAGDVRTHVLCFRRSDLEPLWDAFVAYGSGIHVSSVSPAGSLAHRHGRLYFATHTGLEACLDARTGAVLWAHRYRTPEMAVTYRLQPRSDMSTAPVMWHSSPPAFSGGGPGGEELVAFAPRDSYFLQFLHQRPRVDSAGRVAEYEHSRPRRGDSDMTVLWVLPGPAGSFFLAGQSGGREEAPIQLRDLDPGSKEPVRILWRGALMEPTVMGLPARTRDSVYAITEKALYRIPYPGRDGEVERLADLPPGTPEEPCPSPGNLLVLPDRILSVADDGVMCFGRRD